MTLLSHVLSLSLSLAAAGEEPDGKKLFLAKKCNICHSIKSEGIVALQKDSAEMKISDLSGLSTKRKLDWLVRYLEKKEKLEDKLHPPKFRGEEAELNALSKWLMSLKPAS